MERGVPASRLASPSKHSRVREAALELKGNFAPLDYSARICSNKTAH
jgi:hypothetical protein